MPNYNFGDENVPDLKKILEDNKDDAHARRTLSGKYAPTAGTCRVCAGKVTATIAYPDDDRIGGPPAQGFIDGWSCEGCFLMYRRCPPAKG